MVATLGISFHERFGIGPTGFEAASFATSVARVVEEGAVFVTDSGAIGLVLSRSILDHSKRLALELFFYAPDGDGDALRKSAEAWAAENADVLVMSAHEPAERASNWYRRKGYAPLGRQFTKVM